MINKFRSHSGQAIVEFALVLPLILILLLGIIEFGVIFYNKAMVTNASREGARAGIVYQDTDGNGVYNPHQITEIETVVNRYLNAKLINFRGKFNVLTDVSTTVPVNEAISPGGKVDVVVTYRHRFLVIPNFLSWGNTINISAETVMRTE